MAIVTWNPSDKNSNIILSNNNLTTNANSTGHYWVRATKGVGSGKYYWEVTVNSWGTAQGIGVCPSTFSLTGWNTNMKFAGIYDNQVTTDLFDGNTRAKSVPSFFKKGDVIGILLDMDTGSLNAYVNNVLYGTITGIKSWGTTVYPVLDVCGCTLTTNFGASEFIYSNSFKILGKDWYSFDENQNGKIIKYLIKDNDDIYTINSNVITHIKTETLTESVFIDNGMNDVIIPNTNVMNRTEFMKDNGNLIVGKTFIYSIDKTKIKRVDSISIKQEVN